MGSYSSNAANRSPQKSVPVVSSNIAPASQLWGTCGVSIQRIRWPPMSSTSPSPNGLGGRRARSLTESMQPIWPWVTVARGAASSQSFMAPDSSASWWPKLIHRRVSSGSTLAAAWLTSG